MTSVSGVEITGRMAAGYDTVLTPAALSFLAELHSSFDGRRRELLQQREERYAALAAGGTLDFLAETAEVRESEWRGGPPPPRPGDPPAASCGSSGRSATPRSPLAAPSTSWPRPPRSGSRSGGWLPPLRGWSTAGSRSPVPPTRR